jgi:hypothetical protein
MAKAKTPRTTPSRSRSNGNPTDLPATPVVAAATETLAQAVRTEQSARPEVKAPEFNAQPDVKTPEIKTPAVKTAEVTETRKTLTEVRRTVVPINLEEEIRRRAYQLYEERGCTPGHENDDWLVAEREILTRYTTPRQHSA